MKLPSPPLTLLASLLAGCLSFPISARAENWPCWRGPRGDGTCLEKNVPTKWDPAVAVWKTAVPGTGHASAIVWGDRLFTVTAVPEKLDRLLLCLDRATGKVLWQKTVVHGPLEKINPENSYASGTPATDGKRVYVTFRVGDEIVVAAHDPADGKQLWLVRPGTHAGEWGFSNEPVLYGDKVIVDGDGKGNSFLIALGREDGRTLWRVDRTHRGISYSAPLIREMAGRMQLVQCGDRCVAGFDPDTGKQFWTVDGPSEEFVATPAYSEKAGLVFISSSWPQRHLLAIKPDGRGDVSRTHVAWRDSKGAPYIPSLLVVDEHLFSINSAGVAFCYEAATGKVLWQERLGRHHASPVLIEGLVYFINDQGQVNVVRPGAKFDRVAQYELGESFYASPAISDGQVFLRGFKHLFCIGKKQAGQELFDGKTLAGWKETDFGAQNKVHVKDGAIVMDQGDSMTGVTWTGKPPRNNYELTLEGSRLDGGDFFCTTTFPVGDDHCSLVTGGWGGTTVGLSNVDHFDASENPTTTYQEFKNGTWYRFRIRVSDAKIEAWIDDKQVVDQERKDHKFGIRMECDPSRPLGMCTWCTKGAVRKIRLRDLTPEEVKAAAQAAKDE